MTEVWYDNGLEWVRLADGATAGGVPGEVDVVQANTNRTGAADATALAVATGLTATLPAACTPGVLLVADLTVDKDAGNITVGAGWTRVGAYNAASVSKAMAYRVADGTPADQSCQFTWVTARGALATLLETNIQNAAPLGVPYVYGNEAGTETLHVNLGETTTTGLFLASASIDTAPSEAVGFTWNTLPELHEAHGGPAAGSAAVSIAGHRVQPGDPRQATVTLPQADQCAVIGVQFAGSVGAEPPPPPTAEVTTADLHMFRSTALEALTGSSNAVEQRIARIGHAEWVGDWYPTAQVQAAVANLVTMAAGKAFPVVLYAIPGRDSGGYSAGGFPDRAAYLAWVQKVADGAPAPARPWWILEPDAVPFSAGFTATARAERLETLRQAVVLLKSANPDTRVFIDAGHASWLDATQTAGLLQQAGASVADGFTVNVSNFIPDERSAVWADQVNDALVANHGATRKEYLVDSSRNGHGILNRGFPDADAWYALQSDGRNRIWCNPPGRGAGAPPQPVPGHPDGQTLYVKKVGESDGAFPYTGAGQTTLTEPAPPAGQFYTSWWKNFVHYTDPAHIAAPGTTPTLAAASRFPGDPNPLETGVMWWGACVTGATPAKHETPTGHVLPLNRLYWSQLSDLTPTGSLVNRARTEHAAGRLPWVSFKLPDWQLAADGGYDYVLDPLIDALEGLDYPVFVTINHEPENDHTSTVTDAQFEATHGAAYRGMQLRFRRRMNLHGSIRRIGFGGSLMYWTFEPSSGRNPDAWWPGQWNGVNVWDFHGADHYTEPGWEITRPVWERFVTYCQARSIPFTLPEWGLRSEDHEAVRKMAAFYEYLLDGTHDCVAAAYFDSAANSTGSGWDLTNDNGLLAEFQRLMVDPRSITLTEMGY